MDAPTNEALNHATEETTIPETPKQKPSKKKPTTGFSVVRVEKRVTAAFSILAKVAVIALISVAIIFVARELADDSYTIQQINVPTAFADAGYTGATVANRINRKLDEIIQRTSTLESASNYASAAQQNDVSVDMVGIGVPVRAVIELIGNAVGIVRKNKITGEITVSGNTVIMELIVGAEAPERFETELTNDVEAALKILIQQASETILKYTSERSLHLYYANIERNSEKTIKLAKAMLAKYKANSQQEAIWLSVWAGGLTREKKYEAALRKIEEGLTRDSTITNLYSSWAMILEAQGKYAEALKKDKKAYALLPATATKARKATVLGNIGLNYSYAGQPDSAILYYQKSLALDNNQNNTYYNLSYEHLFAGDTLQFFEVLETALAKGFNSKNIYEDPDMQGLLPDPRMKKLMEKYAEE